MGGVGSKQRILQGLGVSPGIAIGPAHVREVGDVDVPEYAIPMGKVEAEIARLDAACIKARRQISRIRTKAKKISGSAGEELGFLLDASFHMLKDSRLIRGAERRIRESQINAEAALQAEVNEIAKAFAAMDDSYMAARIDDVRDVGNRVLRNLVQRPTRRFSQVAKGSVLIAEELSPADTAQLKPDRVAGLATTAGGAQGHTAIMARALGIPTVLGAGHLMESLEPGDTVIVDGVSGQVIINPRAEMIEAYKEVRADLAREQKNLQRLSKVPAVTTDGVEIRMEANLELPVESGIVAQAGAEGIGLLRTEFMFMNREDIPDEDEQYAILKGMMEATEGIPQTIRTLDIGGEKTAASLMGDLGQSASSALGLRGIRLTLAKTGLLETQFRAILRAAFHAPVRILLPMVTNISEVKRAREILQRAYARLKRRGADIPPELPPLGAMIEVPGAALAADALARASDFFAIGSNDLTMYTLAIDRGDEQVAHLFDPLHPAVLRLIQFSAEAAFRARIPVSICGEVAGDPRYTALLLGLGMRDLSMTASAIPRVKQRIRQIDLVTARARAATIMDQVDPVRIAALVDSFNAEIIKPTG